MSDPKEWPEITLRGDELKFQRQRYVVFYRFMEMRGDLKTFGEVLSAWAGDLRGQAVMRMMYEATRLGRESKFVMDDVEEVILKKDGSVTVNLRK